MLWVCTRWGLGHGFVRHRLQGAEKNLSSRPRFLLVPPVILGASRDVPAVPYWLCRAPPRVLGRLAHNLLAGLVPANCAQLAPDQRGLVLLSFCHLTSTAGRRTLPMPRRFDCQSRFFVTIVALRALRSEGGGGGSLRAPFHMYPRGVPICSKFHLHRRHQRHRYMVKDCTLIRIQIKLEEQERLLLQARMEALQNQ